MWNIVIAGLLATIVVLLLLPRKARCPIAGSQLKIKN